MLKFNMMITGVVCFNLRGNMVCGQSSHLVNKMFYINGSPSRLNELKPLFKNKKSRWTHLISKMIKNPLDLGRGEYLTRNWFG